MIDIAIKHFIYDKCLTLMFDNLIKNFSVVKNNGFYEGQFIKRFIFYMYGRRHELINVTVTDPDYSFFPGSKPSIIIDPPGIGKLEIIIEDIISYD